MQLPVLCSYLATCVAACVHIALLVSVRIAVESVRIMTSIPSVSWLNLVCVCPCCVDICRYCACICSCCAHPFCRIAFISVLNVFDTCPLRGYRSCVMRRGCAGTVYYSPAIDHSPGRNPNPPNPKPQTPNPEVAFAITEQELGFW